MLVLSRNVGQDIIIGDDVVVKVLGVKGNQVRIGVDAPKDVDIMREELYNRGVKKTRKRMVSDESLRLN